MRAAQYWPKPETEARSRAWRADQELVLAAERRLWPLLPPPGPQANEAFAAAATAWMAAASLRKFEAGTALPLFPLRAIYPDGIAPPGYQVRIQPETMRACGGSTLTLAAIGLSPYVADPFLEICGKHRDLLAAWAQDAAGLAAAKWSPCGPKEPPPSTSPIPS